MNDRIQIFEQVDRKGENLLVYSWMISYKRRKTELSRAGVLDRFTWARGYGCPGSWVTRDHHAIQKLINLYGLDLPVPNSSHKVLGAPRAVFAPPPGGGG